MTRNEIIDISRNLNWEEMGADLWGAAHDGAMSIHALERFAALVAEAERARCADIALRTVCDVHTPTGIKIYGTEAAKVIMEDGA